jgi:hypothetical protein
MIWCATLLMGTATIDLNRVESAEPRAQVPIQQVGLFHRTAWGWSTETADVPAACDNVEPGDIPIAPWDRAPRSCGLLSRWHACHCEKKAWHYYIRGVGPAVHERSPGRPCIW